MSVPKGFPIDLETIGDTNEEKHAFVLGFFSPFSRGQPDAEILASYPPEVRAYVMQEWHYYKAGQTACRVLIAAIAIAIGLKAGIDPSILLESL